MIAFLCKKGSFVYLRRIEAQDPEQLAIVQLKGLKLLVWAILLSLFQVLWTDFLHGYLRIPTSAQALAMSVHCTPVAWHLRWASQILFFFEVTLSVAIWEPDSFPVAAWPDSTPCAIVIGRCLRKQLRNSSTASTSISTNCSSISSSIRLSSATGEGIDGYG
jgi:hypothetical protein